MTVLDLGCGPGFFSVDLALMVGKSGRVIATDMQEGMLRKLQQKIQGTDIEELILLHRCEPDKIGWSGQVDFVLAFYVMHEIPDQGKLFRELAAILPRKGQVLVVEPPFHVGKSEFQETVRKAQTAGFNPLEGPKVILSKTVILEKS